MKRIGIMYFSKGEGVSTLHSQIVRRLGHAALDFFWNDKLPDDLDMVLVFGPWGSMTPLANQLVCLPAERRPKLVWWLSEQLPNPALPEWLRSGAGRLRSRLERMAYRACPDGSWRLQAGFGRLLTSKAKRFRYYGDLLWLKNAGVLTCVVQGSGFSKSVLVRRGFPIYYPPVPSYFPEWGADLQLERDIPVLWIGKVATRRRRRMLEYIEQELGKAGVPLLRIDGERHPYVFNEQRTVLLNRTQVVLNLLRASWDNNAMRFQLATLNRAMVISEPMRDQTPFVPGVHIVEVPYRHIPGQILYYLDHADERRAFTERAYRLITTHRREDVIAQLINDVLKP